MYKATSYVFDSLSWTKAKKNKEELEKTNPQNPVLDQQDEEFLHRVASKEAPIAPLPPTVINDDGQEREATQQSADNAGAVALPQSPAVGEVSADQKPTVAAEKAAPADEKSAPAEETPASADEKPAQPPVDDSAEKSSSGDQDSKMTEEATVERSSTETKGKTGEGPQQTKNTWSSYVPSVPSMPSMPPLTWRSNKTSGSKVSDETSNEGTKDDPKQDKVDEKVEGQMPAGVTITEDVKLNDNGNETQDEKEVSVLLDKLHLSSINNRVFSFSQKSQNIYSDFTVILKDMINGAPTAYEDMEKLLKENEGHLGETFASMPPFVQTLIKSLPSKLGTTLGPEVFAAASDKPGADMKARLDTASKTPQKNKKRKVPNVQSLAKDKGMVTTMLSNIVNFLKVRFPFLLTTTNVVMTLSTFILLLVFWYCHKRGKEVRLSREAEAQLSAASDVSEMEEDEDEEDIAEKAEQEEGPGGGVAVADPEGSQPTEKLDESTSDHAPEEKSRDARAIIEEAESKQKA